MLDSAYYSTIRITILILQCSCEQIYFQAFLFQKCIAEIFNRQDSTFYLENYNSSIDCSQTTFSLLDYIQSTCTQTTCSLHPSSLQLNQPTRTFLLGEHADSTGRNPSNILLKPGQGFYQKKSLCYRHLMGQFEFYVYRITNILQQLQCCSLPAFTFKEREMLQYRPKVTR